MADDDLISPMSDESLSEDLPAEVEAGPAAPVEAVQAVEPEPVPAKAEPMVPLAALQAERENARTTKARLDQIEAMLAQQNAPKPPDVITEPEAYQAFIAQQVAVQVSHVTAEMSERFARTQHGDALVDEALAAAQARGVVDHFRGRKDPWGDLTKWHKAQQALAEIGDDPAAYAARVREQAEREIRAKMAAESVIRPAAPTLAGQANLGSRVAPSWNGPTPLADILGTQD